MVAQVAQQPVELILLKQVAGYLATPMFMVDPKGNLLYYNEPAEDLLGHRYEETGEMPLEEWGTVFSPTDSLGRPLPADLIGDNPADDLTAWHAHAGPAT